MGQVAGPVNRVLRGARRGTPQRRRIDTGACPRLATAVAPFSPRGRPGAAVSMPLSWGQVKAGLDPARYTIRTVPPLLGRLSAWEGYDEAQRPLADAIARLARD